MMPNGEKDGLTQAFTSRISTRKDGCFLDDQVYRKGMICDFSNN